MEEDATPIEEREPLSLDTALGWLAFARPASVLTLLREPDFALISARAFAGFRVNAHGYGTPLVRGRLAQEAVRDEKFADRLRALTEEAPRPNEAPPPPILGEQTQTPPPPSPRAAGFECRGATGREEKFAAEQRREREEARKALQDARRSLAQEIAGRTAEQQARNQAEQERDETRAQAKRQAQRIARLERQVGRLQAERDGLLRTLRQEKQSVPMPLGTPPPETAEPPAASAHPDTASLWENAVAHLLDKGSYAPALTIAEDVLRAASEEAAALDIAARAREARGEAQEARALLRRLLTSSLNTGDWPRAAEALLRLSRAQGGGKAVRQFLAAVRPDDYAAIEAARGLLARTRSAEPRVYDDLSQQISAIPALATVLMPAPGAFGPDDALPLSLSPASRAITAHHLREAIDGGDVETVDAARSALTDLARSDPQARERTLAALEKAVDGDQTYLVPLLDAPCGPVVVDGSNVAWHDQESLAASRPRLRPLLTLRRALRAHGFFPILLFADAPLPYTIDEPEALRTMMARHEITVVNSGTDADEVILREARRLQAPLLTNDRMADWDPDGDVEKIRYTYSPGGDAQLLFAP